MRATAFDEAPVARVSKRRRSYRTTRPVTFNMRRRNGREGALDEAGLRNRSNASGALTVLDQHSSAAYTEQQAYQRTATEAGRGAAREMASRAAAAGAARADAAAARAVTGMRNMLARGPSR